jgi:hypothetical protein
MQPAHHALGTAARTFGHVSGIAALGDLMQGEETLTAARMRGTQGQVAQIGHGLTPPVMVNAKHQS